MALGGGVNRREMKTGECGEGRREGGSKLSRKERSADRSSLAPNIGQPMAQIVARCFLSSPFIGPPALTFAAICTL